MNRLVQPRKVHVVKGVHRRIEAVEIHVVQAADGVVEFPKVDFVQFFHSLVQPLIVQRVQLFQRVGNGGAFGSVRADKLIDDKIKDKFVSTMRYLGLDVSDDNKLWFAILPHVLDGDYSDDTNGSARLDDDLDFDEDDDEQAHPSNGTDFSAAKSLIKILDECKIMTVFNFEPNPATTFSALNVETIHELQEKLEPLNCEHAVYALPNFTIMREGTVPLSEGTDVIKISVPAMYIDAAYVAAGLLVAAQQPEYWLSRGFKEGESFISENACVRIDFESDKVVSRLLTKFNRERSAPWSAEVVNALSQKHVGFVFDGDRKYDERTGGFIERTYILNARTLKQKDNEYQSIFRTLTKDFIRTYLKTYGARGMKLTSSQLKDFLNNVVAEWTRQRKKYNPEIINLILRDGENILQVEKDLKVELSGGEDLLDVEIVD